MTHIMQSEKTVDSSWVDLVMQRAKRFKHKTAYSFLKNGEEVGSRITFEELDLKCRSVAAKLQARNCEGERVLIALPSGADYVVSFLACLYAGAVAVPLYPPRRKRSFFRLSAIAKDSGAKLALTSSAGMNALDEASSEHLTELEWLTPESLGEDSPTCWRDPRVSVDSLAYLQYTSGSTSEPKGVKVKHGNLIHNSYALSQGFDTTENDTLLSWLPLFHDMGLVAAALQGLFTGAHCIFMQPESFAANPVRWLQAITRYQATVSGGPNFAYDLCTRRISDDQTKDLDLSEWQLAFSGSEPVRRETIENFSDKFEVCGFKHRSFYPCYGLAEATVFVSGGMRHEQPRYLILEDPALNQCCVGYPLGSNDSSQVSCGHAWSDNMIKIIDPQSRSPTAPGSVGEIWVSGASVAAGYWRNEEHTVDTFHATVHGCGDRSFLRTGDLGVLVDRELYVTGRIKDLIIIAGANHYPQDIERTVEASHELIRPNCSAAFTIRDDFEERLHVVAELDRRYRHRGGTEGDDLEFDPDDVVRAVVESVMEQHELSVFGVTLINTATIPKTTSGKIQRNACATSYLNNSLDVLHQWVRDTKAQSAGGFARTEEGILVWIVARVAESCGVRPEDIEAQRPLTDYVFDSIDLLQANAELADRLGIEVPSAMLWTTPTMVEAARQLAKLVVSRQ